ncbi:glutaminase [Paenibacillus phyllosphaerae]|uniref:Glutaminase n=1 Tax=Paenibacillus phyllosphaerae TaxID=274593 RepID=A0A7W5B3P4_9BACL|nr:glutaminase A [Paenibacillus phyllosphaerae]MBB3113604.1 glutaminase [Paenibacillus phyllosphaerae]
MFDQLRAQLPGWVQDSRALANQGKVAAYIPELAKAPQHVLGITVTGRGGESVSVGETDFKFTMQSISKVFTLLLAFMDHGEEGVFAKVGMEPTGDDFNSMLKLELVEPGKPFNPLINAGAIAVTSLIKGDTPAIKTERILRFFKEASGGANLAVNSAVAKSESATAHRNRSLAYFLKDNEVLGEEVDVEEVLQVYFDHCAVEVDCPQLARMALVLAHGGVDPITGRELVPRRYVQIAKSFMVTCGMYNASGEFAIKAGIPAKSGVSGGILALVPGQYGIGIVGPALGAKGNSTAGVHLLEQMSTAFDWSLF